MLFLTVVMFSISPNEKLAEKAGCFAQGKRQAVKIVFQMTYGVSREH